MIYERIADYCKKEKITVCEFEKRCQIGNGTVRKWREGLTAPSFRTLFKIEVKTGIPVSKWIGERDV